ncbi:sensor histidine kinase [Halogeometricum limi]|uniref:histidine kinase n=1 Tax=Halogeometricum limi TaxID=555875 RepID=A0A1I6HW46_9EURY|nr:HAMP domain-containing sensor histidine kinase [Halogeometricum limi]SFR58692.1 Signal transduction histidine kinase [Halogeometricum limi]
MERYAAGAKPSLLLALVVVVTVAQLLAFPVDNTTVTSQAVVESVFLVVAVAGLFAVSSSRELTANPRERVGYASTPVLFGITLLTIRAVTDVLDEFLAHPTAVLTVLEDGSMIAGVGLLLVGLVRWERLRVRQVRLLRDQRNRLDRQNERLEGVANALSHDLRNPLNVAIGNLELARERDAGTDHLDAVERSLERMETIIEGVLTLARVGTDAVDPTSVSVQSVARRAWETVETKRATLSFETADEQRVDADPAFLQQLFENLFRNCVDHADEAVVVRVGRLDDGEGFFVDDDGPGIPPAERDSVFDDGYTNSADGTGFGLAIVRKIAESHGWTVGVRESRDGGARFEVRGVDVA